MKMKKEVEMETAAGSYATINKQDGDK